MPDPLRQQADEIAKRQGRSADEVAAEAQRRYIAHEMLAELSGYGQQQAKEIGVDHLTDDEAAAYVDHAIHEYRDKRRR